MIPNYGIYGPPLEPWSPDHSIAELGPKPVLEGGDDPLPTVPKDDEWDRFDPKNWGV